MSYLAIESYGSLAVAMFWAFTNSSVHLEGKDIKANTHTHQLHTHIHAHTHTHTHTPITHVPLEG